MKKFQQIVYGLMCNIKFFHFILISGLSLNRFSCFDLKKLLNHKWVIQLTWNFHRIDKESYTSYWIFFNFFKKYLNFKYKFWMNLTRWIEPERWMEGGKVHRALLWARHWIPVPYWWAQHHTFNLQIWDCVSPSSLMVKI